MGERVFVILSFSAKTLLDWIWWCPPSVLSARNWCVEHPGWLSALLTIFDEHVENSNPQTEGHAVNMSTPAPLESNADKLQWKLSCNCCNLD